LAPDSDPSVNKGLKLYGTYQWRDGEVGSSYVTFSVNFRLSEAQGYQTCSCKPHGQGRSRWPLVIDWIVKSGGKTALARARAGTWAITTQ